MPRSSLPLFWFATLFPAALLAIAPITQPTVVTGIAALYLTFFVFVMDRFFELPPEKAGKDAKEFPAGQSLSVLLGFLEFPLLAFGVWIVSGSAMHSWPAQIFGLIAFGIFFGQISHPNAHDLIHEKGRAERLLGKLNYAALLYGHHASAHPLVHHPYVGTDLDPASPKRGDMFYRYATRHWIGSYRAGRRAETARHIRQRDKGTKRPHPYILYLGTAIICIAAAAALAGFAGVIAFIAICLYAQLQILLSDYVQHYGLRRRVFANGKLKPVGPQHSWNAPHWFSAHMMLNAPRHSDHHVNPMRPFPELRLDADVMPMLPYPMPLMAVLALWPKYWRRIMDPRVRQWEARSHAKAQSQAPL